MLAVGKIPSALSVTLSNNWVYRIPIKVIIATYPRVNAMILRNLNYLNNLRQVLHRVNSPLYSYLSKNLVAVRSLQHYWDVVATCALIFW
jgi:hypothetical protein